MEYKELAERDDKCGERHRKRRSADLSLLHVVSAAALVGLAALVVVALPDIKRYIKISRM